jgi:hypothetical protein
MYFGNCLESHHPQWVTCNFAGTCTVQHYMLKRRVKFRREMKVSLNASIRFLYDMFGLKELMAM